MLKLKKRNEYIDLVNTAANIDYVSGGKIMRNSGARMVLVESQSQLSSLSNYDPGTIAFTAGFVKMWQKSPGGTWVDFE